MPSAPIVFHDGPQHGRKSMAQLPMPAEIELKQPKVGHKRMSEVTPEDVILGYGEVILPDNPMIEPYYRNYIELWGSEFDTPPTQQQFFEGLQEKAHEDPSLEHLLKERVAIVRVTATICYQRTAETTPDGSQVFRFRGEPVHGDGDGAGHGGGASGDGAPVDGKRKVQGGATPPGPGVP